MPVSSIKNIILCCTLFLELGGTVLMAQNYTPAAVRLAQSAPKDGSRFKKVPYESIGPSIMSGRITDIEVNPSNPIEMFVAYASGGVFYTSNNGQSFRPVFDRQHVITVGDIAVDWNHFRLVVGTGESNSSRSSYAGTGVYESKDTGHTWNHLGLEETHHIGRILLHPTDARVMYTAAMGHLYTSNPERGVYKTEDGGKTWNKILYVNEHTGCIDLSFDPSDPNTLLAAMWERKRSAWNFTGYGEGSGVYITNDAGKQWKNIYKQPYTGRIGLAPFRINGTTGVYLLIDDQTPKPGTPDTTVLGKSELLAMVHKPLDEFLSVPNRKLNAFLRANRFPEGLDADSLKRLLVQKKYTLSDVLKFTGDANENLFTPEIKGPLLLKTNNIQQVAWLTVNDSIPDLYYTYGYYFGRVYVSPSNPAEVFVLGVVLAYSENGGLSFKKTADDNVHADHHVLWINPSNSSHLINGNDGGLNISYDKGRNWIKCNSPAVGQFYSVAADENEPYQVYGGLQDNGVWKGPRNYLSGTSWHQYGQYPWRFILGGDGMQVAVDTKQDIVYTGYQFGNYYRIEGSKETYITPRHKLGESPYRFNWQTPVLRSAHTQNTLYLGGNFLFRSFDKGTHWQKISPDLTLGGKSGNVPYGTLTTVDESPLTFGVLYTGSDDGKLYVSRDGGNQWTDISVAACKGLWVSRVQASAHKDGRVYVTYNGYRQDDFRPLVYKSDDYGKTWKSISGNLPVASVNVIREDPLNKDILYAGSDNGLYISLNQGNSWEALSDLPGAAVHDMVVQKQQRELVVATHGRSMYVVSLQEIERLDSTALLQPVVFFPIQESKASGKWGESDYFWEKPSESNVKIAWFSQSQQPVELILNDSAGRIVYIQKLIADKGMNYFSYNFSANENLESSRQIRKGKNGTRYLKPGNYGWELRYANSVIRKKWVLKSETE